MDVQKFTFLKDIDVSKTDLAIHVRVIRRWTTKDYKNPNDYFSVELIIIDEENNRMQCTVLKKFAKQYDKLLDENLPLCIIKPSQAHNRAKYKHVPCDHKIVFNQHTKVTLSTSFKGNPFGFSFVDFADILDNKIGEDALIDVIGHVVIVFEKHNITRVDGSSSVRRNIKIEDLQKRSVFLTLWGSYCDQMDTFIKDHPDETNVVVVLQFAKCKWFQGEPYVSNSFDVARLWIDSDIDEINSYKNSFLGTCAVNSSQQSISSAIVSSGVSIEDDFLKKTSFCFISDIHDLTEANFVIILGTIKGIDKDINWFYEACSKCFKKATISDDKTHIQCSSENCHDVDKTLIIRYKIPLRVQDSSGTVTITMFDRDARKILGISAADLKNNNDEFDGDQIIPKRFDRLMDQKMAFKIQVKDFNLKNNVEYYTISRITQDDYVISVLDLKFDEQESPRNDSFNLHLANIDLDDSVSMKDTVSSTGENVTPLSELINMDGKKDVPTSTPPSDGSLLTGVKRNLSNVYELDDNSTSSSSKSRSIQKTIQPEKLIIPKLEK